MPSRGRIENLKSNFVDGFMNADQTSAKSEPRKRGKNFEAEIDKKRRIIAGQEKEKK